MVADVDLSAAASIASRSPVMLLQRTARPPHPVFRPSRQKSAGAAGRETPLLPPQPMNR